MQRNQRRPAVSVTTGRGLAERTDEHSPVVLATAHHQFKGKAAASHR